MNHKRYQVFVSSTFEDLKEARQKVIESLLKLRCLPAVMEFFVASDNDQWSLIQRVIDESDYYVVIVAAKYGSTITDGPDAGMSYTEKEYRYAREKSIPVYGFVHKSPEKLPMEKHEESAAKKKKLKEFREMVTADKMVSFWETEEELGTAVTLAIAIAEKEKPRTGWVRGDRGLTEDQVKRFFEMEAELKQLREQVVRTSPKQAYDDLADLAQTILRMSLWPHVSHIEIKAASGSLYFHLREGGSAKHPSGSAMVSSFYRESRTALVAAGFWEEVHGSVVFCHPTALAFRLNLQAINPETPLPI